jgi:FkbM family methyltransferase
LEKWIPRDKASVDAGANLGIYARRLAALTPRVYAFEPAAQMARTLRRTVPSNVIVREIALSDREGHATLHIPIMDGRYNASLASIENALPNSKVERVTISPLDHQVHEPVGYIKIDTEGHELKVLEGATGIIDRWRPIVQVECEERHNPGGMPQLFSFFSKRNYQGTFLNRSGRLTPITKPLCQGTELANPASGYYVYNFIFFPMESWKGSKDSVGAPPEQTSSTLIAF